MARLSITVQAMPAKYPTLQPTADSLDITWTAAGADFADGFKFPLTGKEILLVRNGNVAAKTVTISSVVDAYNRTGDITTYSIGASEYARFPQFQKDGWMQSDGYLYGACSAADMYIAVLRLSD